MRYDSAKWAWLAVCLAAFVLVPFVLWEDAVNAQVDQFLARSPSPWLLGTAVGLLMAADVLLPVPSSVVATAAGALLGTGLGTLSAWLGMCLGCVLAYGLGRGASRGVNRWLLSESDLARASSAFERSGPAVIALCRPVPVLAEISVIFAGIVNMPKRTFLLYTSGANLGIAGAYAWLGAQSAASGQLFYALLGSLLIPGVLMAIARLLRL